MMDMSVFFNSDRGIIQAFFGDDASLDPGFVLPVVGIIFVFLVILAFRILLKDKGRNEMTPEELERDRALFDGRMEKQAALAGKEYVPELARAAEESDLRDAESRLGKNPPQTPA